MSQQDDGLVSQQDDGLVSQQDDSLVSQQDDRLTLEASRPFFIFRLSLIQIFKK